MKTLYLDCGMGAAGDMLTAALIELIDNKEGFINELNSVGIPDVTVSSEITSKCGIQGTHISVKINGVEEDEHMHEHHHSHEHEHSHNHEHTHEHSHDEEKEHHHHHHHASMHDIEHIINDLSLSEKVKKDIINVYSLIAEAESFAHGVPMTEIHFHEVGTMDAIADVAAVCMLMDKISPESVVVSPIHVGSGHVKCAHGILPVPAPATAYILKDVPIYGGGIKSELCTPTGAALLKYFATDFGQMPVMKVAKIGYGMGKKDFTAANCVRAMLGEADSSKDIVVELCCNLDDMTGEAIGFAQERLFAAGALEVYTVAAQMKKSRPGQLLSVMCYEKDKDKIIQLIFQHTTTLGIRENISRRYILSRSVETVSTEYGDIKKKVSTGYGIKREKYEYEDIADIARRNEMSLSEVTSVVRKKDRV